MKSVVTESARASQAPKTRTFRPLSARGRPGR